jgi:hypothetical protein
MFSLHQKISWRKVLLSPYCWTTGEKRISLSSTYKRQDSTHCCTLVIIKNYASRAFLSRHVMYFTYFWFHITDNPTTSLPSLDQPLGFPPSAVHLIRVN